MSEIVLDIGFVETSWTPPNEGIGEVRFTENGVNSELCLHKFQVLPIIHFTFLHKEGIHMHGMIAKIGTIRIRKIRIISPARVASRWYKYIVRRFLISLCVFSKCFEAVFVLCRSRERKSDYAEYKKLFHGKTTQTA